MYELFPSSTGARATHKLHNTVFPVNFWIVFPQPGDTNDHCLLPKPGDVERNVLAMFSNSDKEIHHIGDLSVSIFRSISVQHLDGEIDGDLLEVVFLNERGVNVAATGARVKESDNRELLMVIRGEAFDFNFRELRSANKADFRHVWDFFGQARERGIQEKRI